MGNNTESGVGRRRFLSGVAVAAAAPVAHAANAAQGAQPTPPTKLSLPTAEQLAADAAHPAQPAGEGLFIDHAGSDFMVDVIKSLKIDYIAAMPGSSFRGLHESLINYGNNKAPEFITCLHEEASVGIAHGYAKVAGKPMLALCHGTVGMQHAAMAVYNAWCDRAPVVIMTGNLLDATQRRPGVEWNHSMQDNGALLRDCTKWDDQPASLNHFGESLVRAYKIAMTAPMGPVLIVADADLQEKPMTGTPPVVPRLTMLTPPQGDDKALAETARLLVAAENPVIVVDRVVRTPEGMAHLVELAELLGVPVIDKLGRLNFPTDHDLNLTDQAGAVIRAADVVLGIEVADFWGTVNQLRDVPGRDSKPVTKADTKLISLGTTDLMVKSNYQDFQRYEPLTLAIAGDGKSSLPALIEAVKASSGFRGRAGAISARRDKLRKTHTDGRAMALREAAYAYNAGPVATARLYAELWPLIQKEDWALVSDAAFQSNWPHRLWNFTKPYQFIGGAGGAGVGYSGPAAVGAALAHKEHGRFAVNVMGDGELMCVPGSLWTASHHRIPLLTVMHNNRAYHQEVMHIQRMAGQRRRGIDRAGIGTTIVDPPIDYAKLAQSMGMEGIGPVTTPDEYVAALKRAVPIVKSGAPVLIDVVSQPR